MDASGAPSGPQRTGLLMTGAAARVRRPEVALAMVARPPGAERRLLWRVGELERRAPWRRHAPDFDPTASPVAAAV
jgi:amidase